MENLFSIGELAKYQNISKQTLIFYDRIGLFRPDHVNPENGYRYYSARQIDYLDTILIMKKIGFSLDEIRDHMKNMTAANSLALLRQQLDVIGRKIDELSLIKSRLSHRCEQLEQACAKKSADPELSRTEGCRILYHNVEKPYSMREISIATKKCYAQAFAENLPVFYQSGVSVPLRHILSGCCTEAGTAFLTTDSAEGVANIRELPAGLTVSCYHFGSYSSIESSYSKLLEFCRKSSLEIISDSYEFCINDYITSRYEEEFITKIDFYLKKEY